MTDGIGEARGGRDNLFSLVMWGGAAALLALPGIAGAPWTASDFVLMGAMLTALCGAIELGLRASADWRWRVGVAMAALGCFMLVWIDLAVGIVGDEDNPLNLLYLGVAGLVLLGSVAVGFRARAMAGVLALAAAAIVAVGVYAWIAGGEPGTRPEVPAVSAVFAGWWLAAAALLHQAARGGARG